MVTLTVVKHFLTGGHRGCRISIPESVNDIARGCCRGGNGLATEGSEGQPSCEGCLAASMEQVGAGAAPVVGCQWGPDQALGQSHVRSSGIRVWLEGSIQPALGKASAPQGRWWECWMRISVSDHGTHICTIYPMT